MRAHYLQHAPFEGLGSIREWLTERRAAVTGTRLYESAVLPPRADMDLLVLMGGPMSVNDTDAYPWLAAEKRFIGEAVAQGKAVFGVCLGAQLIAGALGARVFRAPEKEIGWFPVNAAQQGRRAVFPFPEEFLAFHWHGETFDLPPGAAHLARSTACEHQAFSFGANVLGMQFHLEVTPVGVRDLVACCSADLTPGRYVASVADIERVGSEPFADARRLLFRLLDGLVSANGRDE